MKTAIVETSPITNFKVGSKKLMDNGLTTLIQLLFLAIVVYVFYQIIVLLSLGDSYQDLVNAIQIFESDASQTTQLKDAFVEFMRGAGVTIVLSWVIIGILSLAYSVATMRVYINSIRGKDTVIKEAIQTGLERTGVSLLFALYVTTIVIGYIILATMLSALLPILIIVVLPISFVLLAMLVVRVLYSYQILSDVEKPTTLTIFETSKKLVQKSGTALFLYILFALALSVGASVVLELLTDLFGAGPSNNYSLTTDVNDVVYNIANFVIFAIVGFFLNAGWVEIYNQAKGLVDVRPKATLSKKKILKKT